MINVHVEVDKNINFVVERMINHFYYRHFIDIQSGKP